MSETVTVAAPLTGTIDTKVAAGKTVEKGELLAVQISSKTEVQITAPNAGRVKSIVDRGATVNEGGVVAELEI